MSAPPATGSELQLVGVLDRVLFHNPDNSYSVVTLALDSGETQTVVGPIYAPTPGQKLQVQVRPTTHPKYGKQLELVSYTELLPTSADGLKHYLSSRFVKGLGPTLAANVVEHFGDDTIDVLDRTPERLTEVKGIGEKRMIQVRDAWRESQAIRQLMMFLGEHGVGPGLAVRIHHRYGSEAIARIRVDPYQLAMDVDRIGFQTADAIAQQLGIPPDSPRRLKAGLLFALHQSSRGRGHCCLPRTELLHVAARMLVVDAAALAEPLDHLLGEGHLIRDEAFDDEPIYLPAFLRAERELARRLRERADGPGLSIRALADDSASGGVPLSPDQLDALETALSARLTLITGGPGVGKTTLIRRLVETALRRGLAVALAAPTGRAARRMAEATGHDASTIHRLLNYNPALDRFDRDAREPLVADLVIVDEASMIDLFLMRDLMRAIPVHATLILVGDADQLPSVGPGTILRDLIGCGRFPVARLTEVFRQAEGSRITEIAHRINRGEYPDVAPPDPEHLEDFYLVPSNDPDHAAEMILKLVGERIPARFDLDPRQQVQVIAPMHKGPAGTIALNERLRDRLNPDGQPVTLGGTEYRVGDKVMQVRNDYDAEVFNGDVGYVTGTDAETERLTVDFDGRTVSYGDRDADDLQLAYCVTVHKSQGSEYPAVVVPILMQHFVMLQRNLLYTAITRGKRLVVLIGNERALRKAVDNAAIRQRHSHLADRLTAPLPDAQW